ncbi:MAG: hypothetical protein JJE12_10915 [Anaerolineales bacterium]|nr:hypothetical protein [Anaerolineales bacterium]
MRIFWILAILVITIILPMHSVRAQEDSITESEQLVIISPDPGQALQGTVLVLGETGFDAPTNVRLSFSYRDDPRNTWFIIQEFQRVVQQELRYEWDTTTITDGDYTIRLFTETEQGEHVDYVEGLRVRNYTAVETSTPVPTSTPAPQDTLAPTITPTRTITAIPPTATALPPNPAQITTNDVWYSILQGALITLGLFAILGVIQVIRRRRNKNE